MWVHADLLPPDLTVAHGALAGVLDFGMAGVGDPAADVVAAAWTLLDPAGRAACHGALDVGAGTWARARAHALQQAADIVWCYRETHPAFATSAVTTIERVLHHPG